MSPLGVREAQAFADVVTDLPGSERDERPGGDGPRVDVLQAHSDDAALSIGGLLRYLRGQVGLVSVFSGSDLAEVRHAEDVAYADRVRMDLRALGFPESTRSAVAADSTTDAARTNVIGEAIRSAVPLDTTLLAPAGVGDHPDHVLLAEWGERLGCQVFWEDVAFWGIYGASVEDRLSFVERRSGFLAGRSVVAVDITATAGRKANDLRAYGSQSHDRWRPVRYASAVAAEHGLPGFCERLFVGSGGLAVVESLLPGASVRKLADLRYGRVDLPAYGVFP